MKSTRSTFFLSCGDTAVADISNRGQDAKPMEGRGGEYEGKVLYLASSRFIMI